VHSALAGSSYITLDGHGGGGIPSTSGVGVAGETVREKWKSGRTSEWGMGNMHWCNSKHMPESRDIERATHQHKQTLM